MRRLLARIDVWSTWLATACLAAAVLLLPAVFGDEEERQRLEAGRARIRTAISGIPDQLGSSERPWLKVRELEVPPTQQNMLGLTGHVSREYERLGDAGRRATLFFAHSSDARSMSGHHPPNCYPRSGWTVDEAATGSAVLRTASGRDLPMMIYRFTRGADEARRLWVANGFIVPGERPVATLEEARTAMSRAARSRKGLAQYQLVFWDEASLSDVERFSVEILEALPDDLFEAIETIGSTRADEATEADQ